MTAPIRYRGKGIDARQLECIAYSLALGISQVNILFRLYA